MRRLTSGDGGAGLGALVAAGAVARFATLDAQSFWTDEAATVLLIADGLDDVLDRVAEGEAQPPLYFVLAWLWTRAAGTGEVGLRSLSALLGTLTIPIAFAIGARLGGRTTGLLAAALVAFNPFLIWFSQEARTYALLVVLTSTATLFWLRALTDPHRRASLAWGAAGALALLTHYFAVFFLVPQALVLWRAGAGRRAAAQGIAVVGAAALILAPLALAQRDARVDWVGDTPLSERVLDVPKHWIAGPFGSPVDIAVVVSALLLAASAGLVARLPRDQARSSLLLGATAVAAAALPLLLAAVGVDYVLDRYLIASLVPLLAVAAHGFASVGAGRAAAAALGCLFLAFTLTWVADPELHREDWRAVAQRVSHAGGHTAVITTADGERPLLVYLSSPERAVAPVNLHSVLYVASWRFGEPRPAPPPPPHPDLKLAERANMPTITLVHFRANRPIQLTPGSLAAQTLIRGAPSVALLAR